MARDANTETEHPAAARDHALHADLVLSVCHVPPGSDGTFDSPDDPAGQITPRISWDWDVTPVQRIQLTESAMALLTAEHTSALAEHGRQA